MGAGKLCYSSCIGSKSHLTSNRSWCATLTPWIGTNFLPPPHTAFLHLFLCVHVSVLTTLLLVLCTQWKGWLLPLHLLKKNNNNKNQYMPCAACVFVPQHYFHSSFADRLWGCVIINSPLNCTFLMHILTSSSISSLWPLLDLVPSILLYNGERGCFTGILAKDYFFWSTDFLPGNGHCFSIGCFCFTPWHIHFLLHHLCFI